MGQNSTEVAYGFGQMGSGHVVAHGTDVFAPKGKVIPAKIFKKILGKKTKRNLEKNKQLKWTDVK